MTDSYDPIKWFSNWPHEEKSVFEAWEKVHARFGMAAQRGCDIETGLIMIISQLEQLLGQKLHLEGLLENLGKNGRLPLGPLIELFCKLNQMNDEVGLVIELRNAKNSRNYLIHHFYRDKADLFTTLAGCEKATEILLSIYDDMDVAMQYLEDWVNENFGHSPPEERWDEIQQDVVKWKDEQQVMLNAILGKSSRAA